MEPTQEAYAELQTAYAHFNEILFEGKLPPCLITLQRHKKTYGYFSHSRFENPEGTLTDEIAMNPEYFGQRQIKEVLGTLVHEMVHLWQAHFGKCGRRGYHNLQWGHAMEAIGLVPSNTGQPGGKRTGDRVTHYKVEGGPFEKAADLLLDSSFRVTWADRYGSEVVAVGGKKNRSNREKFRCPECGAQAWGKPGLNLRCGTCAGSPSFVEP
jgi:hypothetical protein